MFQNVLLEERLRRTSVHGMCEMLQSGRQMADVWIPAPVAGVPLMDPL